MATLRVRDSVCLCVYNVVVGEKGKIWNISMFWIERKLDKTQNRNYFGKWQLADSFMKICRGSEVGDREALYSR